MSARSIVGIDCGSSRLRVVRLERRGSLLRLAAAAATDWPGNAGEPGDAPVDPRVAASVLEQLVDEVGGRGRKCVMGVSASSATLRGITFPRMSWSQRRRAAEFGSDLWTRYPRSARLVRVYPVDREARAYVVAVADRNEIERLRSIARHARARVVAIDHCAYALRRVLPDVNAILDIGARTATLHEFSERVPRSFSLEECGGFGITRAMSRELDVAPALAEVRKRIVGTAGAGIAARRAFVERIASLVHDMWPQILERTIALVGNGARLDRIAPDLAAATGARIDVCVSPALQCGAYPDDVVRAAAPDWTLAVGLATWGSP